MSVQERCEILYERLGGVEWLFAAVLCNGCGRRVVASTPELLAEKTEHWRLGRFGEDADYCPGCLG